MYCRKTPKNGRRARVLAERMRFHERLELRDLRAGIRGLYGQAFQYH
jgi:hypothetical protein